MRRLVALIGAIVLVDTMFYGAVVPLLPELVDELGLSKGQAGVLSAANPAGTLLGALPAGWLAARFGVKPAVLLGLALMSASGLAFAFGDTVLVLDCARFAQGVGAAASWAGGMAWLAAQAPRERRGEVLGTALGAAIIGVQLGPVIGALATATSRELAFSSAVAFGALLALWAAAMPAPERAQAVAAPGAALRDARMRTGMWLTALPGAAFGVVDVLAPLRLDELGATGLAIGATFFAAAGAEALVSPIVGRVTDRRGALAVVPAGLVAGSVALAVLQAPQTAWALAPTIVVAVGALGLLWVPAGGLLSRGAEAIGLDQAIAFAWFNLAWAVGFTAGAAVGGGLAGATADVVPYALLIATYAASVAFVLRRGPTIVGAAEEGVAAG